MKLRKLFVFVIINLILLSTITFASNPESKLAIKVKFDRSFYNLEYSESLFEYREDGRVYKINVNYCNRAKLSQIVKNYRSLLKEYSSQHGRVTTKYDVEVVSDGKKIEIARGSDLGTWLRSMPNKIMYLNAESQVLCKR